MEDKEYEKCNKKFKNFLKKDKIGQIVNQELESCLRRIFLEGYNFGKLKEVK